MIGEKIVFQIFVKHSYNALFVYKNVKFQIKMIRFIWALVSLGNNQTMLVCPQNKAVITNMSFWEGCKNFQFLQ